MARDYSAMAMHTLPTRMGKPGRTNRRAVDRDLRGLLTVYTLLDLNSCFNTLLKSKGH